MTLARTVLEVAPSGLNAAAISSSQINLSWQANPRATSYRVRQNGVVIATQAGVTLSVTGLTPSTPYNFTVASVGLTGEGPQSSPANATTQATGQDTQAPTVPGIPTVTPLSSSSMLVQWAASTDNFGVTAYLIERRTLPAGAFAQVASQIGTLYTDNGVAATTSYEYRIRAQDAAGNTSAYSAVRSGTTPAAPLGGRLWAGLSGPAEFSRELLAMNAMKYGRRWLGQLSTGFGAGTDLLPPFQDANGYLTQLPPTVIRIEMLLFADAPPQLLPLINGRYRFLYDGVGTIEFFASGGSVTNVVSSAGQIEFDYVHPGTIGALLSLMISSITPGNYPRNMRLFKVEYATRIAAGFITRPNYEWSNIGLIRLMDMLGTNSSVITSNANRPTPGTYTWVDKGCSIEEAVQIANELGINPWFNIPHLADDAYVTTMATIIRDQLNPALKCYVEWSNETWNFGPNFAQSYYCLEQALALFGQNGGTAWLQFAAGRSSQCMNIFSSVFAGQTSRITRVLGAFTPIPSWTDDALDAPLWTALGRPAPRLSYDAVAVTGYWFGWSPDPTDGAAAQAELLGILTTSGFQAATNWLINRLEGSAAQEGSLAELYAEWDAFRALATRRNLDLLMYEGGIHVVANGIYASNPAFVQFVTDFSYTPETADIYRQALTRWDTVGDGGFNAFVTIGGVGVFGNWGAMRWPGDLNPRALLLQEYNAAPLAGGKRRDVFAYLNSLHNHDLGAGNANTSTANWIARMVPGAVNGGNIYTCGNVFGFAGAWPTPPVSQGQEEVTTVITSGSWVGSNQVEIVEFVPDNFEGVLYDPGASNGLGFAYTPRLLQIIDAWEANAPNPSRVYAIYAGWPDMSGYGDPATLTTTQRNNYIAYALGAYQTWMELLVTQLRAARPSLNIRLHNVNKATVTCWRDTVVNTIPAGTLFEDDAPHGRSSWYFLAGVADYVEIFNEKPPANFAFNPAWGVSSVITSNYQAIVDNIYQTLRP